MGEADELAALLLAVFAVETNTILQTVTKSFFKLGMSKRKEYNNSL